MLHSTPSWGYDESLRSVTMSGEEGKRTRGNIMALLLLGTSVAAVRPAFTSENGTLYADGHAMQLKGLNWYGFETSFGAFHGLYAQPPSVFLDLLQEHQFNAVRIPLDVDLLLDDRKHGYIKSEPWPGVCVCDTATHREGELCVGGCRVGDPAPAP